jgi:hypothetical protein
MTTKAIKISKAIKNSALAKKLDVRHYLTITLDHAQYYGFHGSHHGVGSCSESAVQDLIELLPEGTPKTILIALENIATEEGDEPALIGYRVYQKEPGAQVDIEIEEIAGQREINKASRPQERDSDGVLDCVVLYSDFLPEDCDVLKDAFRDAYNNCEHYYYASLDLSALKDHLMEIQAEMADYY